MKDFKDISWNVSEDEYRNESSIHYSMLSRFQKDGFSNLNKLNEKIESPSIVFGSLVDTMLTGEIGEFKEKFMISPNYNIGENLKNVVDTLYELYKDSYKHILDIDDNTLSQTAIQCGYYSDPKYINVRLKKIKECADYYDFLQNSDGKILVTEEQYNDALGCVNILQQAASTKELFGDDGDIIKHYYQLKFKGKYDNIPIKCMTDLIIVDELNKKVYPYDLKTSWSPEWEFPKNFVKLNYIIQAQMYWYIIRQNMDNDDYFKDFELADFQFIVICNKTRTPLVWNFSQTNNDDEIKFTTLPKWKLLIKELYYYLTEKPVVPIGISVDKPNDIFEWLTKDEI